MCRLNPKFTEKQIQKDVGRAAISVSVNTIKTKLKLNRFTVYRAMKPPKLNKKQMKVRLDWANKYSSYSVEDWKKVPLCFKSFLAQ